MQPVKPEVRLLARPEVDWLAVENWLTSIGGLEWFFRHEDTVEENLDGKLRPAEYMVEMAGRRCYQSWAPGVNPNVTKVRTDSAEYLENILKVGHGSVIEHVSWSFALENVSRVFTHELVRHRPGMAYSQESLRFVRLDNLKFWFPEWAEQDPELMERSLALLEQMEKHQLWMAEHFGLDDEGVPFSEKKHKTSFMRRFAPEGLATGIVMTANARSLRHLIKMRTDPAAEEEIRVVFQRVAELMYLEAPLLFCDFEVTDDGWHLPKYVKV